jgi:hypothetical protein
MSKIVPKSARCFKNKKVAGINTTTRLHNSQAQDQVVVVTVVSSETEGCVMCETLAGARGLPALTLTDRPPSSGNGTGRHFR